MLYPPIANLLEQVDGRYLLVNVVAKRARQIAHEANELDGGELPEKPVTMAIKEVAAGELTATLKEEYLKEDTHRRERRPRRSGRKFDLDGQIF